MTHCSVYGCNNNSRKTSDIHYFRFPREEEWAEKWLSKCRRADKINTKTGKNYVTLRTYFHEKNIVCGYMFRFTHIFISLLNNTRSFFAARICSVHFEQECYYKSMREKLLNYSPVSVRKLRKDAVPTLHIPDSATRPDTDRMQREKKRVRRNLVRDLLLEDKAQ